MSTANYSLLHGFPTVVCGSSLDVNVGICDKVDIEHCPCPDCATLDCTAFGDRMQGRAKQWFMKNSSAEWDVTDFWKTTHKDLECHFCQRERKRRARVIHRGRSCGMTLEEASAIMNSKRFEESVLIAEYNKPVTLYAQLRSQTFARMRSQQLLWIQAVDTPPPEHFGDYSAQDLQAVKRVWLDYHTRKTEGVPSLFPCTLDMPARITDGRGKECKEYKIHNGSKCRIKGWQLDAEDEESLRTSKENEVVLKYLPLVLFVELQGEDRK